MTEEFDPYRKWLGIPRKEQPPHHYRLLGIDLFEDDPDVIENAATRQMSHLRTLQSSKHSADSQRLLNELSAARICLLSPGDKVRYDQQLRAKLFGREGPPAIPPPPTTPPTSAPSRSAASAWRDDRSESDLLPHPVRTTSAARRTRVRRRHAAVPILVGIVVLGFLALVLTLLVGLNGS